MVERYTPRVSPEVKPGIQESISEKTKNQLHELHEAMFRGHEYTVRTKEEGGKGNLRVRIDKNWEHIYKYTLIPGEKVISTGRYRIGQDTPDDEKKHLWLEVNFQQGNTTKKGWVSSRYLIWDLSIEEKKEETPVRKEETPVRKEETPVRKEETPVRKEETPVRKEETPVKKEETPVKKEETPVKKEETPVKQEETPVKQEETPVKQEEKRDEPVKEELPLWQKKWWEITSWWNNNLWKDATPKIEYSSLGMPCLPKNGMVTLEGKNYTSGLQYLFKDEQSAKEYFNTLENKSNIFYNTESHSIEVMDNRVYTMEEIEKQPGGLYDTTDVLKWPQKNWKIQFFSPYNQIGWSIDPERWYINFDEDTPLEDLLVMVREDTDGKKTKTIIKRPVNISTLWDAQLFKWIKNSKQVAKIILDDPIDHVRDYSVTIQNIYNDAKKIKEESQSQEEIIQKAYELTKSKLEYDPRVAEYYEKLRMYEDGQLSERPAKVTKKEDWSGLESYSDWNGVCEWFSDLFLLLLSFAGVDNVYRVDGISGSREKPSGWYTDEQKLDMWHAWVKIDDKHYDVTWDDEESRNKWFSLTDEEMRSRNREWGSELSKEIDMILTDSLKNWNR
jgi:hypothetical protein